MIELTRIALAGLVLEVRLLRDRARRGGVEEVSRVGRGVSMVGLGGTGLRHLLMRIGER